MHRPVLRLLLLSAVIAVALPIAPVGAAEPPWRSSIDATVAVGQPETLTVWNRPIVTFRARIDTVTPALRVERIRERIAGLDAGELTKDVKAVPSTLGHLSGYWIQLDQRALFAVLPEDVDPDAGLSLEQTAEMAARNLAAALQARSEQQRLPLLLRAIALTLIATVLFAAVLGGAMWLRGKALRRLQRTTQKRPLRVRGLDLRPYLRAFEDGAIKAIAIGLGLVAGYAWLAFVLLQYPYTQPWGAGLGRWLISRFHDLALGAASAIPGFFTVVVIFLLTRLITQAVTRFFRSVEDGWIRLDWLEAETARATRRLVVVLIWIFALTVAYPYIPGSGSEAFKGISVLVGLMISLGATGFVNQAMSGLVVVYSRSLKTGEYVQVDKVQGRITEIGILATKMTTPTRQEITIPNATLVNSSITNYSRMADEHNGSIIGTTVTIGYDTPWRQVQAMLLLAAERTEQIRKQPAPEVRQRALNDFYVAYELLFSIDRPEMQRLVLSDLHANIQDVFNEFGVQIMSPNFVAQPAEKVWVPQAAWYEAPAEPPAEAPRPAPSPAPADSSETPTRSA